MIAAVSWPSEETGCKKVLTSEKKKSAKTTLLLMGPSLLIPCSGEAVYFSFFFSSIEANDKLMKLDAIKYRSWCARFCICSLRHLRKLRGPSYTSIFHSVSSGANVAGTGLHFLHERKQNNAKRNFVLDIDGTGGSHRTVLGQRVPLA